VIAGEADALGGDDIRELQKAGVPVVSLWIIQYPSHRRRLARQDRSEAAPPGGRSVLSLHLSCRCIGREFQEPRTNSKTARPASVHPDELGKGCRFFKAKEVPSEGGVSNWLSQFVFKNIIRKCHCCEAVDGLLFESEPEFTLDEKCEKATRCGLLQCRRHIIAPNRSANTFVLSAEGRIGAIGGAGWGSWF
jgi:hypothetical protein